MMQVYHDYLFWLTVVRRGIDRNIFDVSIDE